MISDERLEEIAFGDDWFSPEVKEMAQELLALRSRKGRTMPRHEFSQMVNELRDVPAVQSKREQIVRVLHAFNINPALPE